jgi:hypothetical protein
MGMSPATAFAFWRIGQQRPIGCDKWHVTNRRSGCYSEVYAEKCSQEDIPLDLLIEHGIGIAMHTVEYLKFDAAKLAQFEAEQAETDTA